MGAHVSALTVFSASAIPGESPKAIGVRDQRVTFLVVSIMLGVSIVLAPVLQALGLGLLWYIKSSPAALAFPIFVVMMLPYRWSMKFIFTETELDALDGPTSGQNYDKDDDEEEDFYEAANAVPTAQPTQMIHK